MISSETTQLFFLLSTKDHDYFISRRSRGGNGLIYEIKTNSSMVEKTYLQDVFVEMVKSLDVTFYAGGSFNSFKNMLDFYSNF